MAEHNRTDDYTLYTEYIIGVYLWKAIPPIIIVLVNIGSIGSVIILNRKSIRKSECSVYLTALSISDMISVNTGLVRHWIYWTFGMDIREMSVFSCKLHSFTVYFALDFSSWMLVAITVNRVALVCFPAKSRVVCTKRSSLFVTVMVAIILCLLNGHFLFGFGDVVVLTYDNAILQLCSFKSTQYKYFFETFWPWFDLVLFCGIPSLVLIFGNMSILIKVVMSRNNVARITHLQRPRNLQRIKSMTATMFSLNTGFLLSTLPISVYLICYENWYLDASIHDYAVLSLMWVIVNILMYGNNCVNFGLYFLSSRKFRNEAAKLLLQEK